MAEVEMLKFDTEKLRVDLLPPGPLQEIAQVLQFGAGKYGEYNWTLGTWWHRCYGAALRHLWAWWGGEDRDPETGLSHLAHAACCLIFLLHYKETRREFDNRPYTARSSSSGTVASEVPTNGTGAVGHS